MPIGLAVRKKPSTHMPLITIKFLVLSSRTISAWLRTQEIKITMSYLTSAKTAFLFTKYPTMLGMTMFRIKNYSVHSMLPNIPTALNYR